MEVNLIHNLIFIKAYNDILGVHSVPIYARVCSNGYMKTKSTISFIRTKFSYENVNTLVRLNSRPKCQNYTLVQLDYYPTTLLLSQGGH